MRLGIVLSLWISVGCAAFCQGISPPQFYPYNGPRVAYVETFIAFTLLADDFQPGSMGGILDYDLLAAPSNTSIERVQGNRGEQYAFITWQTPPRSAVGTTNRFVIRATDQGFPPLSATNEISFVVLVCQPSILSSCQTGYPCCSSAIPFLLSLILFNGLTCCRLQTGRRCSPCTRVYLW